MQHRWASPSGGPMVQHLYKQACPSSISQTPSWLQAWKTHDNLGTHTRHCWVPLYVGTGTHIYISWSFWVLAYNIVGIYVYTSDICVYFHMQVWCLWVWSHVVVYAHTLDISCAVTCQHGHTFACKTSPNIIAYHHGHLCSYICHLRAESHVGIGTCVHMRDIYKLYHRSCMFTCEVLGHGYIL